MREASLGGFFSLLRGIRTYFTTKINAGRGFFSHLWGINIYGCCKLELKTYKIGQKDTF
jgi:hypothetical protein